MILRKFPGKIPTNPGNVANIPAVMNVLARFHTLGCLGKMLGFVAIQQSFIPAIQLETQRILGHRHGGFDTN